RHALSLALGDAPPAPGRRKLPFPVRGLREEPRNVGTVGPAARARERAFERRRGMMKIAALEKDLTGKPVEADGIEAPALGAAQELGNLRNVSDLKLLLG